MKLSSTLLPVAAMAALSLVLFSCSSSAPRSRARVQPRTPVVQQPTPQPRPEEKAEDAEEVVVAKPIDTRGLNPLDIPNKKAKGYANPYPKGSYEYFVAKPSYPRTMNVYSNDELLGKLTASNSKIIICIPQQRARLYVDGKVAFDWPVSTGRDGHETPTGAFRVMEKQAKHFSNRYGKFVNKRGRVVSSSADTAKGIPAGMTFSPSAMPNWHRLTWDGVGIHGGRVAAGQRLSHGCIRSPYDVAAKLYEHSVNGMPVYISRAVEDYNRGGYVKPIDVKYRPKPGNDYTDTAQSSKKA